MSQTISNFQSEIKSTIINLLSFCSYFLFWFFFCDVLVSIFIPFNYLIRVWIDQNQSKLRQLKNSLVVIVLGCVPLHACSKPATNQFKCRWFAFDFPIRPSGWIREGERERMKDRAIETALGFFFVFCRKIVNKIFLLEILQETTTLLLFYC